MTIKWYVSAVDKTNFSQAGKPAGTVTIVHWRIRGVDGTVTSDSVYGATSIPFDDKATFTDLNNLTQDQVIEWVKAAIGPDEVERKEKAVQVDLDRLKNPPSSLVNPWAPVATPPPLPVANTGSSNETAQGT